MTIVTISRQLGSGGNKIAASVAEALDLGFIHQHAKAPVEVAVGLIVEASRTLQADAVHN